MNFVNRTLQLPVYDVFLIDSDFRIERPTRYYRQGLHLLHADTQSEVDPKGKEKEKLDVSRTNNVDHLSAFGSIRSRMSHIFKKAPKHHPSNEPPRDEHGDSDSSSSPSPPSSRAPTPLLDPSTNTNPLLDMDDRQERDPEGKQKKKRDDEVSKHTFYIENAQMRLKLFARNEVKGFLPLLIFL